MNTPAHLLIGAAAFARPAQGRILWAALLGSLLPDLSLYLMAGTSLYVLGIPPSVVFNQLFFPTFGRPCLRSTIPLSFGGVPCFSGYGCTGKSGPLGCPRVCCIFRWIFCCMPEMGGRSSGHSAIGCFTAPSVIGTARITPYGWRPFQPCFVSRVTPFCGVAACPSGRKRSLPCC